ncbi:MAG: sugar ABC transporter permease, partial [Defluviitaleaceae bacterium]|nr:sugar ABC transporter permease [Defluviitaleaceae bacterium]
MTSAPIGCIPVKKRPFYRQLWKNKTLIIMCLPVICFFIVFNYLPLPGIYIAFVKFNYKAGIFGSKYIGMENFRPLFMTGKIWELTRNTLVYNLAFIITGNLMQVIMALLFNEMAGRYIKKVSQSLMILP